MANLFAKAAAVAAPAKTSKKSTKEQVQIDGLEQLASIDALMKALAGAKAAIEGSVKEQSFSYFVEHADGKKPESFRGVDGKATASMEMRKRGTNSPLTAEQVALLTLHGIPVGTEVAVQELYVVNPAYSSNSKLLEEVSKAIQKVKGVPEDFIQLQAEKSKQVVTDDTVTAVFAAKVTNEELVRVVTTLAVKPTLAETDISKILDSVKSLLVSEEETAKAALLK